ncbi:amidohydrolase family protein [Cellulophaga sp. HaHaR_3_176]|uniref:amidohydrolase family protein n=1 Tax=Cellulophaga sp. HaHaR_3_176 TaxID=1942464 RepID=UPI001C1F366A|nr:amidohydrolase family protein [Cellulophaga sp. HaHaR_3_176]QWX83557.1 amidohydrolase family protein [Cellulophaga sp. HaHaR_3_176]
MKYICALFFIVTSCFNNLPITDHKASDKVIYDVVFREGLAGKYEKWKTDKTSVNYYYTYTDRGRGPEFSEELSFNKKGFVTSQTVTGVNYLKDSIQEFFKSENHSATWLNPKGEKKGEFNGDALYFRYDGSPAIYEVLARLLLSSENQKVKLYPIGEVELVENVPIRLSNNTVVKLLMVKGLDMNPTYLWMIGNEMVAKISGNLHVIRTDLKELRLEMKGIQDTIEDEYLTDLTKKLSHKLDKVVIKNVNIFTPEGNILKNQDVLVHANRIAAINSSGYLEISKDIQVINGQGKTLLPGMFDMHTHNTKFRGMLHVAGGVTSVRDLANNKQLKKLSNQFNTNEIIGPRIVTFGGIIDGDGPFANQRNVVSSVEEGLAEIQEYKDLDYQQIKLYSSIRPEWVAPLTKRAHELDMRVSGHIPAFMTATQAINQGYDEIQHMNMVLLNFLSDTIDTRTPLRHTMSAYHGVDLNLKSKEYLDFVQLLKTKNIRIDPTVSIFENMFVSVKGEPSPTYIKILDRLPLLNQRDYYSGGLPKSGEKVARYKGSFNKMLAIVYDLHKKGVEIVPGTDGLPGFLYHRELELYAQAGIPASEVLQLATIKSAEMTGVSELYGAIEVGKMADLILIDGNPLEDISTIRNVKWTMKDGNLFYAKEVYQAMGIKHFK